ncbi:hypothetical protein H5410_011900 [Solanum commersonii]|uniref:Uncharacterized protein n=1 Tax=Solanum commersonii TaxID=4109 RepID=A0A9J6AR64_SOLCO|nr:hypothetical protein H5410_011900 [Solanum commersonii]
MAYETSTSYSLKPWTRMHLLSTSIASTLLVSWGFPHLCSAKYMDFIGASWMKRLASRVLCDKKNNQELSCSNDASWGDADVEMNRRCSDALARRYERLDIVGMRIGIEGRRLVANEVLLFSRFRVGDIAKLLLIDRHDSVNRSICQRKRRFCGCQLMAEVCVTSVQKQTFSSIMLFIYNSRAVPFFSSRPIITLQSAQ